MVSKGKEGCLGYAHNFLETDRIMSNVLPKHTFWYHTVGERIYTGQGIVYG